MWHVTETCFGQPKQSCSPGSIVERGTDWVRQERRREGMCSCRQSDLPSCSRTMAGRGTCCRERAAPPHYLPPSLTPSRPRPPRALGRHTPTPALQRGEGAALCLETRAAPAESAARLSNWVAPGSGTTRPASPPLLSGLPGKTGIPNILSPPPSRPYPSHAAAAREGARRVAGIPPQSAAARSWVG